MSSLAKCVFIGTGTSEGVPLLSCLFGNCSVCHSAMVPGSKNRRRNISVVISYKSTNIIIDISLFFRNYKLISVFFNSEVYCGKLWWDSALEILPKHSINHIEALILSHEHADAMGGLDNLRDYTMRMSSSALPVYASESIHNCIENTYPYIFKSVNDKKKNGGVPSLYLKKIVEHQNLVIQDLQLHPFFVPHGSVQCCAFRIGGLCYISDVDSITETMLHYINNSELIIDCLYPKERFHPSHLSLLQLKPFFQEHCRVPIPPKHIYLVGMNHTADTDLFNKYLQENGFTNVECAYDGESFSFNYYDYKDCSQTC